MAKSDTRYEEKLLKKSMSPIWKGICKDLEDGIMPQKVDWADFMEKVDRYTETAMPEWKTHWEECVRGLHALQAALKQNDLATARMHMENVYKITKACHKKWKD